MLIFKNIHVYITLERDLETNHTPIRIFYMKPHHDRINHLLIYFDGLF